MDLFEESRARLAPLPERMRAETLDDFIGQKHIVGEGSLLRRAIACDRLGSCIFWGPPGTGKTTLANVIAKTSNSACERLNAVSSGVADLKKIIDEGKDRLSLYGKKTYLLLDECHRWSKAQSDCLLPAVEKGYIIFIGSTTENPYASMTKAIVSRCRVFEMKKLSDAEVKEGLLRALFDEERGLGKMNIELKPDALEHFCWASDGDMRVGLNSLELAALTTPPDKRGKIVIDISVAEQSIQKKHLSIDETMYYDMLSAFCKSLRGSDSDAAVYYAMRLIEAGCDPMLILRRLVVHSAEDVGLADPNALAVAVSAMAAFERLGYPEGRIPLTEAIIYVAEAYKSNSVVRALDGALSAATLTKDDAVPENLRDPNYKDRASIDKRYKYPHDFGGWVEQQYLPDSLKDARFYVPGDNGAEKNLFRAKIQKKTKK